MSYISNILGSGLLDYIQGLILQFAETMLPILILVSIPALIFACANCFFGYRIFRIILVVQGVLIGALVGGTIIGVMSEFKMGGVILGAVLGAVIGGLINWYLYMIGVFLQSFGVGFFCGMSLMILVTSGSLVVSSIIGLILGLIAGVLSCLYLAPVVIITTSINGGSTIAACLAGLILILSKKADLYNPLNIIFTILFAGVGIYFQYVYWKKMGGFSFASQQPVQYQQQSMPIQQQTPVQTSANRICQIIGVEGMYKGFEFDIDSDTTFGRDAEQCNIVFPKETNGISRVQCQVTINPERTMAFIVDNHSTYGTQVNGEKLNYGKMKRLNNGDIIHFGDTNIFRVQY